MAARLDPVGVAGEDSAVAELRLVSLQEGQNRLDVGSDRVAAADGLGVAHGGREGVKVMKARHQMTKICMSAVTVPATKGTSLRLSL